MKDSWKPRVGCLVIIVSIVFGLGFGKIVAPLWTDDIGDQVFWSLFTAVLFFIAVFGIIIKIDIRKKPKDTV